MAEFEVERVGGELKRFGVEGSDVPFKVVSPYACAGREGRRPLSGFVGRDWFGQDLHDGKDY